LFGVLLGKLFSHPRKTYWIVGYFISFVLILFLLITRYSNSLAFEPMLVGVTAGRLKYVLFSLAVTMGLTTPLSRLPYKFERAAIYVIMAVIVVWFAVLPFLVPALIQNQLANLTTTLDSNGICFQTTDFTCAPAAAVTALGQLGLPANEGEIAILAHTSPVAGTLPGCLQTALQKRYGDQGLKSQYRRFDSIAQLKDAGLTLAVVKSAFLTDHCVAILEVSDDEVIVADPAWGKKALSYKEFEEIWRFSGIVLKRDAAHGRIS
jgi:predicted double-glycine peptidase